MYTEWIASPGGRVVDPAVVRKETRDRKKMLTAFATVLKEYSFDEIGIAEIAQEADIHLNTLYAFTKTCQKDFREVVLAHFQELVQSSQENKEAAEILKRYEEAGNDLNVIPIPKSLIWPKPFVGIYKQSNP